MEEILEPQAPAAVDDEALQAALKARGAIPEHIAIIMDGNGRWAKSQGKVRFRGHSEGVESVRDITEACAQLGVSYLTLYTFSSENWSRPETEVNALMRLLIRTLEKEVRTLDKNDIRLTSIGDVAMLPKACQDQLALAKAKTAKNTRMTLNLALSYGGRWEIVHAVKQVAERVAAGTLRSEDITEQVMAEHMNTAGMPDPELLIRTGGELRVSNFLLWQIAYTEFYVTDTFWPAFRRRQLYKAIGSFQDRERRFGGV